MLQVVCQCWQDGVDVVVGIVEIYGCSEIVVLFDGFDVLLFVCIDYCGCMFVEFDLDGVFVWVL